MIVKNNTQVSFLSPTKFPLGWATEYGEDSYGLWMVLIYKGVRSTFRWIEPGSFVMRPPGNEEGPMSRDGQHEVSFSKGFWLTETVVTIALWESVMGTNDSGQFKDESRPAKLFISYTHDSFEHQKMVLTLVNRFRKEQGIDCQIDQLFLPGGPIGGWMNWMRDQIAQADYVLIVCTPTYRDRYERNVKVGGNGATFEGLTIPKRLREESLKFIPVICDDGSLEHVPPELRDRNIYSIPRDFQAISDLIKGKQYNPLTSLNEISSPQPPKTVSWKDAQAFIKKFNTIHPELNTVLPSEAQWEYAYRSLWDLELGADKREWKKEASYQWGEDAIKQTSDVKYYPRNAWGLYEIHGNVLEWCRAVFIEDLGTDSIRDPLYSSDESEEGTRCAICGGAWDSTGRYARFAYRNYDMRDYCDSFLSFRLSLMIT